MAQKPYAAMQSLLKDQTAAAQEMKNAATAINYAAELMASQFGGNNGYGPIKTGDTAYNTGSQPVGDRPTMRERQTYRPIHTGTTSAGTGLTGIRSKVADMLHNQVGNKSGSSFDKTFNEEGQHVGYRENNPDGSFTHHDLNSPGIEGKIASAGRRSMVSSAVEGLSGGGLRAGLKAVPYVGEALMAAEAIHGGLTMVGKQREANASYQSIYGGSNFGTGFGNRMQGEGFKLGQLFSGGLTGAQSDQAFQGVSSLGYQGQQRSSDLNFISSNYKSMGMDVSSSLQLITTASKNLNANLSGLKASLQSVSDVAKQTGQNAAGARALFSSNYSSISSAAPGVAAAPIAGAISGMQTGMGRSMQGIDMTGMYTSLGGQAQLALLAPNKDGSTGGTIGQFRAKELTDPGAALKAGDTLTAQIAAPFLTPNVRNAINQIVNNQPGGVKAFQDNPDLVGQLITPVIIAMPDFNSDGAALSLSTRGLIQGLDPVKATTFIIMQALGIAGNASAQYQKQFASPGTPGSVQQDQSKSKFNPNKFTGGDRLTLANKPGQYNQNKGFNPVVDQALSAFKGKNVIVDTGGGKRVVSINEAASQYTDQVAKGTAILADTGQSISYSLGGAAENNYQGADTTKSNVKAGSTKKGGLDSIEGMDKTAYDNMQAANAAKTTGNVVISASPELQKLLTFSTSGNVALANQGAATNSTITPGTGLGS